MAYGRREPSIFDSLSLSPLPYPVLLILLVVLLLLGLPFYSTYEELVEETEEQINWILIASPIVLLLLIRWISSVDSFDGFYQWFYPYDRRGRGYYGYGQPATSEGASPWGVAAVVVLVLVLVSFQSSFQEMWGF